MGEEGGRRAIPRDVDLDYDLGDFFPGPYRPDSEFYLRRLDEATIEAAQAGGRGRVLDVACGTGMGLLAPLHQRGWEVWGLDASQKMLRAGRSLLRERGVRAVLVRGIAEALPFRDDAFDCLTCKGSLDHFADPLAFMEEAARVLRPGGRLIIALTNYESLSCRLGRLLVTLWMRLRGRTSLPGRPYWQPPPDHTFKGDYRLLMRLGRGRFRLVRCYGVSLLWLFPGWGRLLERLPPRVARGIPAALDRLARPLPPLSDAIISIWTPVKGEG